MSRILVLGAGGMAGHIIATYLSESGHDVSTVSARNKLNDQTQLIDVTQSADLKLYLDEHHFDVIVNCIGMLIKASDEHKDLAVYLNSFLPHQLEMQFKNKDTKIIHLSTDCVFSGKNAPYYENSWPDGELFYDRTKALGEIDNDKDLTFRMSIIGPDMQSQGIGLFNWFYAQKGEIGGFTNVKWNGITTIELAKAVEAAMKTNLTGLYHLVPEENISKHDLLALFKEEFSRDDISIKPLTTEATDKTLINSRRDFIHTVPSYKEMVTEMKAWVDNHQQLYKHYGRK